MTDSQKERVRSAAVERAHIAARWYVWGLADAGTDLHGRCAMGFASHYADIAGAFHDGFHDGTRNYMPSVMDAWREYVKPVNLKKVG